MGKKVYFFVKVTAISLPLLHSNDRNARRLGVKQPTTCRFRIFSFSHHLFDREIFQYSPLGYE